MEGKWDGGVVLMLMDASDYEQLHLGAVIIGGCFALVALTLSFFLILQHLRFYTNPSEQKWIAAVVFMVPVYATESFLSLWNPKLSLACDILRNCYEAFALYAFGSYLVACLGGEHRVVQLLENESRKRLGKPLLEETNENQVARRSSFVNFFFRPCLIGGNLFAIERFGLVQYMILKTVCAFLAFILEIFGVYGDEEFKFYYGYPYLAVILNFSQMWALYCLVQFYNVMHEKLKPIKPLSKFISFKAIVFATWWQGVGIALLSAFHVLPNDRKLETGLQDFLICIEMAIASVAHIFVFSAEPYHYVPAYEPGRVTVETVKEEVRLEEGSKNEQPTAIVEDTENKVQAPGTSMTESVQDIVLQGGQCVMKDVVLTINQAMGPVEKGVAKIHNTFHSRRSVGSESEVQEKEQVQDNNRSCHRSSL